MVPKKALGKKMDTDKNKEIRIVRLKRIAIDRNRYNSINDRRKKR